MRKILLLVFLLFPFLCSAQYAEFSANVGLIPSTNPKVVADPASATHFSDFKSTLNGYFSGRISMNIRHIQFGAAADIFGIQFSQKIQGSTTIPVSTAIVARPAACPSVFVNYKWYLPGSYVYLGLSFGEIFNLNQKKLVTAYPTEVIYPDCNGWYYGGQAGYSIVIGNRTRINIECGVRYTDATLEKVSTPWTTDVLSWSRLSFPVSIGLRYRFTKS